MELGCRCGFSVKGVWWGRSSGNKTVVRAGAQRLHKGAFSPSLQDWEAE